MREADVEFIIGNVHSIIFNVAGTGLASLNNRIDFLSPNLEISEDFDLFLVRSENLIDNSVIPDGAEYEKIDISEDTLSINNENSGRILTNISGVTFISLNGGLRGTPWFSFGDRFILRFVDLIDRNIDSDVSILKIDEDLSLVNPAVFISRTAPEDTNSIPINASYRYELGKVVKSRRDWVNFLLSNFPQFQHIAYYVLEGSTINESFLSFQLKEGEVLSSATIRDFFTSIYNSTMIGSYLPLNGNRQGDVAGQELKNKMVGSKVFAPSNSIIKPHIDINVHLSESLGSAQRNFVTSQIVSIIKTQHDKTYPFSSSSFIYNNSNIEFLIEQLPEVLTCDITSSFIDFMIGEYEVVIAGESNATDMLQDDNATKIIDADVDRLSNLLFNDGASRINIKQLRDNIGVANRDLYMILHNNFWDYSIQIDRVLFPEIEANQDGSTPTDKNVIRYFFNDNQIGSNIKPAEVEASG